MTGGESHALQRATIYRLHASRPWAAACSRPSRARPCWRARSCVAPTQCGCARCSRPSPRQRPPAAHANLGPAHERPSFRPVSGPGSWRRSEHPAAKVQAMAAPKAPLERQHRCVEGQPTDGQVRQAKRGPRPQRQTPTAMPAQIQPDQARLRVQRACCPWSDERASQLPKPSAPLCWRVATGPNGPAPVGATQGHQPCGPAQSLCPPAAMPGLESS